MDLLRGNANWNISLLKKKGANIKRSKQLPLIVIHLLLFRFYRGIRPSFIGDDQIADIYEVLGKGISHL